MMAKLNAIFFVAFFARLNQASGNEASSVLVANVYSKVRFHVRDIVGMLQSMQQQVMKDGEDDAELFGKYMFYCRRGKAAMETAIEAAENTDLEALQVGIDGESETKEEILNVIHEDEVKKLDAEKAIKKSKALRAYEAAVFDDESAKLRNEIAVLKHATAAVEKGEGLDTAGTRVLKQLSGCHDIKKQDRDMLTSLLEQVHTGAAPPKQDIKKALMQMTEVLKDQLETVVDEESEKKDSFGDYKDMIKEQANALKSEIEQKEEEIEELDQDITVQKDSLEDASRYLMEGPAFLPFVGDGVNCNQREDEWADRCEVRTSELGVCAEVISVLNDEEKLDELLKKLTPEAWQEGAHPALLAAKEASQAEKPDDAPFDIMKLAAQGKNASLTKISNMYDGVVAMLGKEPNVNSEKYCGQSLGQTEDNLKKLSLSVSDLAALISQHEQSVASLTAEINEATTGAKMLDSHIVNAAMVRKQEHEEHAELLTINGMTRQLFETVRDKLSAYYSKELTLDADTSGKAVLGDIIGPYHLKREECNSIIETLNETLAALNSEIHIVERKETSNQKDWETAVKDSLEKHTNNMKAISDKQGAKTALEASLATNVQEKKVKMLEVKASSKYLSELKGDTGFLQRSVCAAPKTPKDKDVDPGLLTGLRIWT